ncbi:PIN domain-containing protein [Sinorhizobium meliloti]|uniref:PIN domain-containing protein n=1 Tax=Rhizobium meliloti TaxID=382 RepID=UPI0020915DE7|nr:PIN domain-containing protein [Sinorhizobium meliloti]MCO5962526.1 PIN domain-containing protein [Sinorhizobium meliloti]
MTVPAAAQELGGRLPSASEKAAANHLRKILAAHATGDAKLRVLDDEKILADKDVADATVRASRARASMEAAFEEATVVDFDQFLSACEGLPDENDAHVVAAALKTQAAVIVTDNLRDFPEELLRRSNLEARSADAFIADTIALDTGRAVAAVRRMRERFRKPEKTADVLLLDMEANGLTETVDVLKPHILSL